MIIAICMQIVRVMRRSVIVQLYSLLNLFTEIYFLRYRILAILRYKFMQFFAGFCQI